MERRYDIDWLRILLFALLVPHHAATGFVGFGEPIYGLVNDRLAGPGLELAIYFSHGWRLPSLFVIAGIGTAFATKRGITAGFIGARMWRLLVPVVFGVLFLNMLSGYALYRAGAVTSGVVAVPDGPALGFFAFWSEWLSHPRLNHVHHLWFLVNLAIYTLILWPAMRWREQIAGLAVSPAGLLGGIVLAVTLIAVLAKPFGAAVAGEGYQFPWYLGVFAGGYLIGVHAERVLAVLELRAFWFVGLGVLTFAAEVVFLGAGLEVSEAYGVALAEGGWAARGIAPAYAALPVAFAAVEGANAWMWAFAVIGLAARYLRRRRRALSWLTRAVFPFYVLHFPVVLIGLSLLAQVSWPWGWELLLLIVGTYVVTGLVYLVALQTGRAVALIGGRTVATMP